MALVYENNNFTSSFLAAVSVEFAQRQGLLMSHQRESGDAVKRMALKLAGHAMDYDLTKQYDIIAAKYATYNQRDYFRERLLYNIDRFVQRGRVVIDSNRYGARYAPFEVYKSVNVNNAAELVAGTFLTSEMFVSSGTWSYGEFIQELAGAPTTHFSFYPTQVLIMGEYHSKEYGKLPWRNEVTEIPEHFARLSHKFPGQVSFYENPERMEQGRRLVMKAGRYLTRFYPDMCPQEVRRFATMATNVFAVQFARTEEDIERVYLGGPRSCMSKSRDAFGTPVHPTAVYAESDLAVAYIGDIDSVSARAVVWPAKKLVGRIYGDTDRMVHALVAIGYDVKDKNHPTNYYHRLTGARIRYIPHGFNHYITPYMDGSSWGSIDGDYITIDEGFQRRSTQIQTENGKLRLPDMVTVADTGEQVTEYWARDNLKWSEKYNEWVENYTLEQVGKDRYNCPVYSYIGVHRLEKFLAEKQV